MTAPDMEKLVELRAAMDEAAAAYEATCAAVGVEATTEARVLNDLAYQRKQLAGKAYREVLEREAGL